MDRLERELQQGLRNVAAPPELWERVMAARSTRSARTLRPGDTTAFDTSNHKLVWALAAIVVVIAVGLASLYRERLTSDEALALRALATDSHFAFRCQNPAQLRAWASANTGLDLPVRVEPAPDIQLISAQTLEGARGVEVAYRAGNHDAVLVVSPAEGLANQPHNHAVGNVCSWVMDGHRYTLACNDPADLQLACKLCHLD